jgi:hypothetical protein
MQLIINTFKWEITELYLQTEIKAMKLMSINAISIIIHFFPSMRYLSLTNSGYYEDPLQRRSWLLLQVL